MLADQTVEHVGVGFLAHRKLRVPSGKDEEIRGQRYPCECHQKREECKSLNANAEVSATSFRRFALSPRGYEASSTRVSLPLAAHALNDRFIFDFEHLTELSWPYRDKPCHVRRTFAARAGQIITGELHREMPDRYPRHRGGGRRKRRGQITCLARPRFEIG